MPTELDEVVSRFNASDAVESVIDAGATASYSTSRRHCDTPMPRPQGNCRQRNPYPPTGRRAMSCARISSVQGGKVHQKQEKTCEQGIEARRRVREHAQEFSSTPGFSATLLRRIASSPKSQRGPLASRAPPKTSPRFLPEGSCAAREPARTRSIKPAFTCISREEVNRSLRVEEYSAS